MRLGLTFDDVLLVPQHSAVLPSGVDVSTKFSRNIDMSIPISSSAMDTVTESAMAAALGQLGGVGVIHKNNSIDEQVSLVQTVKLYDPSLTICAAVGVSDDWRKRTESLIKAGIKGIVLDSAHGHSENVLVVAKTIKRDYSEVDVIVGNVATASAAQALCDIGIDAIKVGIGPGSICTTRIVAGVGVPQLTAILDVVPVADRYDIPVIADGGIKHSGDIVKALAAGADSVMIGSLLAATDQSPGAEFESDGIRYKSYRGMGSEAAMSKGSKDRYFQSESTKFVPEGVEGAVPLKGATKDVIFQLVGGLRSGMGYCGAKNLASLRSNAEFIQITTAGLSESHVHGLSSFKKSLNYGI
jgi:IMP dehydrogenase